MLLATITFAQTTTDATTSSTTEVDTTLEAREQTETTKEQKKLTGAQQTRITNLSANISNRLEATITRLEIITKRLEARMQIMNAQGLNVDEASLQLLEVHTTLNGAQRQLENIDSAVASVTGGEKPQATWAVVRTTFIETHRKVVLAKEQLSATVLLLRRSTFAEVIEDKAATTSPESSI